MIVHPGSRIRMLTFSHPGSRIQGSKRHPIPDPGSGSATLLFEYTTWFEPPKKSAIGSALPIQDINYESANILALTCSFRHTVGPYCLCEFSHLEKAKRIKGLSRHRLLIMLVQAEKEICYLHKSCMFKWQIAIDRHSPRLIPNQCHLSDPTNFLLPLLPLLPTFNEHWIVRDESRNS